MAGHLHGMVSCDGKHTWHGITTATCAAAALCRLQAEKKRRTDEAHAKARAAAEEAQRRLEQLQVRHGVLATCACVERVTER